MELLFLIGFGGISVISAILVVTLRNIVYSALFLGVFLLNVAGIFFLLQVDFLGIVQILLYIGGIAVLIMFAIMLITKISPALLTQTNEQKYISLCFVTLLFIIMSYLTVITFFKVITPVNNPEGVIRDIGRLLMTVYVLPFELTSVILLAVIIGAIAMIGKNEGEE